METSITVLFGMMLTSVMHIATETSIFLLVLFYALGVCTATAYFKLRKGR